MSDIVKELNERSQKMLAERPQDMDSMRKRMGARDQNASIAIYAYVDIGATADILYYWEKASLKEDYELSTLIKIVSDWMLFVADRIPRYYRFHETSALTVSAMEALKTVKTRAEAKELLKAIQHYYTELKFWIDLDIPWPEIGDAYAKAKGDPAPRVD
ncbi:MAG: hypothetical protein LBQ96_05150 [Fusobacteriaceae bacterium]|jgi:hypothetical protein|nr:hypothetical protein [Fusobacteriaceae bacterium]